MGGVPARSSEERLSTTLILRVAGSSKGGSKPSGLGSATRSTDKGWNGAWRSLCSSMTQMNSGGMDARVNRWGDGAIDEVLAVQV